MFTKVVLGVILCLYAVSVSSASNPRDFDPLAENDTSKDPTVFMMKVYCKDHKVWGVAVYTPGKYVIVSPFIEDYCNTRPDDFPSPEQMKPPVRKPKPETNSYKRGQI
jgi:hypothetical protein